MNSLENFSNEEIYLEWLRRSALIKEQEIKVVHENRLRACEDLMVIVKELCPTLKTRIMTVEFMNDYRVKGLKDGTLFHPLHYAYNRLFNRTDPREVASRLGSHALSEESERSKKVVFLLFNVDHDYRSPCESNPISKVRYGVVPKDCIVEIPKEDK
jgi:hypothetical protein